MRAILRVEYRGQLKLLNRVLGGLLIIIVV